MKYLKYCNSYKTKFGTIHGELTYVVSLALKVPPETSWGFTHRWDHRWDPTASSIFRPPAAQNQIAQDWS